MVGAIHGRVLTAWSVGIFGPLIVNYSREYQLSHGVPHERDCCELASVKRFDIKKVNIREEEYKPSKDD